MDNKEIIEKIKQFLEIENFCDMLVEIKAFEKEYQKTDFYKTTKLGLLKLVIGYKLYSVLNFEQIAANLQKMINKLDYSTIMGMIEMLGTDLSLDMKDINEGINVVKEFNNLIK